MRYICTDEVDLPDGWLETATEALAEVVALPDDEKAQAVSDRAAVWKDAKSALCELSHGKCWYCESKEIRSDNPVDHFRPKSRVRECPGHCGYWWLAFEVSNFRFACTFCNSRRVDGEGGSQGGKQDHFPLRDETVRAHAPQDDLQHEQPLLLDPTCPADPSLLWFDEDGSAVPNPNRCQGGYAAARAQRSVELLHLNHRDISDRRAVLSRVIKRKVEHADAVIGEADEGDALAGAALRDALHDLTALVRPDAEFSAAARALLASLRGNSPAAEAVFQSA